MRILISTVKKLTVEHNGEELDFRYSVWAKLFQYRTEEIFGLTNHYLSLMSGEKQDAIFQALKECHYAIRNFLGTDELERVIRDQVNVISKQFDFTHLNSWGKGRFKITTGASEADIRRNPTAMTYRTEELEELYSFVVGLKVLTPIFGSLTDLIKEEVGNDTKELYAANVMVGTGFWEAPAFLRFRDYIDCYAKQRENIKSSLLARGVPKAIMDDWILGLAVVRRLVNAKFVDNEDANLILYAYKFIDDRIKNLSKDRYTDKGSGKSADEEDGMADKHRIPTSLEPGQFTTMECSIEDIEITCRDMKFNDEQKEMVISLTNQLMNNPNFTKSKFHAPLIELAMFKVIFAKSLPLTNRLSNRIAVATAATYYYYRGSEDISRLLLAIKCKSDPRQMSMSAAGKTSFKRLSPEMTNKLIEEYKGVEVPGYVKDNPGLHMIDCITKEILAGNYEGLGDIENLRLSIAREIIDRPWKVKK